MQGRRRAGGLLIYTMLTLDLFKNQTNRVGA